MPRITRRSFVLTHNLHNYLYRSDAPLLTNSALLLKGHQHLNGDTMLRATEDFLGFKMKPYVVQ